MINEIYKNLIIKFLSNSISKEEEEELRKWLSKEENKPLFKEFVKINHLIEYGLTDLDINQAYDKFSYKLKKRPKIITLIRPYLKYAAIFIGLLSIIYFYKDNLININKGDILTEHTLKIVDKPIILELSDGTTQQLNTTTNHSVIINTNGNILGNLNKNKLSYAINKNTTTQKLVYNELTVPHGKLFQVELSDGTRVHLNSGSSLKYPIKFIKDKERKVYLKGEGYFDVTHNPKNQFIVNTTNLDVTVLGTKFNISSYENDTYTNTVLIEGSVKVSNQNLSDIIIKPNEMVEYNKQDKSFDIEKVNTVPFTSWLTGKLIFDKTPFNQILKKLERKYNVTIINNYKELDKLTYNATFEEETIEQILELFKRTRVFDYKIENNKIIITNPLNSN